MKRIIIIQISLIVILSFNISCKKSNDTYIDIVDNSTLQKEIQIDQKKEFIFNKLEEHISNIFPPKENTDIIFNENDFIISGIAEFNYSIKNTNENGNTGETYTIFYDLNICFDYQIKVKNYKIIIIIKNPTSIITNVKNPKKIDSYQSDDFPVLNFIDRKMEYTIINEITNIFLLNNENDD